MQAFVLHSGFICGNGGLLGLPMKRERAFYGWSPAGGWVVYIVQVLMVVASAVSLRKMLNSALQKALKVRMEQLTKAGKGKGKGREEEGGAEERGRRVLAHHDQSGITTDTTTTAINSPSNTDPNTPLPTRPHTPATSSTTAASSRRRLDYLVWEGIETITAGPSLHLDPRGGRLPDPGFTHAIARRNLARRSGTTTPTTGSFPLPNRPRPTNVHRNGYGNGNGEGSSKPAQRRPLAVDEQGFPFPRMPPRSLPPRCQSRGEGVYIPLSEGPVGREGRPFEGRRRPPVLRQIAPMPITGFSVPVPGRNGNGNGKPSFAPAQPSPLRFGGGFETAACTGGGSSEVANPQDQTQRQDEGEAHPAVSPTAPAPEPETGAKASVNINGSSRLERLNPRKQTEEVVFELASNIKPQSEAEAEAKKGEEAETPQQGTLSRANSLGERTESESEAVEMGMPPLERCPKRVRALSSPDSGVALDEMV